MKAVATALGVSRSNVHERLNGSTKPRRGYHKAQDAVVLRRIQALVAKRPTYGYCRITALLNRELRAEGLAAVNHKRVYRIMERNNLLLERSGFDRPERKHDGKVIMMRSNLRWCSDGLEFACWNGDVIAWPSSSTLMTERSYLGVLSPMPGSADPMCETCCWKRWNADLVRIARRSGSRSCRITAAPTRPKRHESSRNNWGSNLALPR